MVIAPRNPPSSFWKARPHSGHRSTSSNHPRNSPLLPHLGHRLRMPRRSARAAPTSGNAGRSYANPGTGSREPYGLLVVHRPELRDPRARSPDPTRSLRRDQHVARPNRNHVAVVGFNIHLTLEQGRDLVILTLEATRLRLTPPQSRGELSIR